jgi:uncharacterized protein (DUF362 family)
MPPYALTRRELLAMAAVPLAPYSRRSTVALMHGEDRRRNVYNALMAVDDQIRPLMRQKRYVLIKPNCVAAKNQLSCTHADALRGILDYVAPRFRGPVVIAESSKDETRDAYENFLYNRVVDEYRAQKIRLVDLNEEENYLPMELMDQNLHQMRVRLATRLFDPQAFILATSPFKAHDAVVATLSVKNMAMGAPLHSLKGAAVRFQDKARYHVGFRQMHFNIMLTAKRLRPFWGATVIDAWEGMEGAGPLSGTPVPSRVAIASTDLVAADRVGVECMGVNPEWVGYLNYCCEAGLGQYDLAKIDLRGGVPIEKVRRVYKLHPRVERQMEWMGPLNKA